MRNGLVVALHHSMRTPRPLLGWPRYYIEWHTMAAPQAAQNQLISLICQRTSSTAIPELKVAILRNRRRRGSAG